MPSTEHTEQSASHKSNPKKSLYKPSTFLSSRNSLYEGIEEVPHKKSDIGASITELINKNRDNNGLHMAFFSMKVVNECKFKSLLETLNELDINTSKISGLNPHFKEKVIDIVQKKSVLNNDN